MFTSILSFLGGGVFRMVWGELSAWLTKKQDHKQELELMRLQAGIDNEQHKRNMEAIRVQAELGVKTIAVQAEADIGRLDAEGRAEVVKSTTLITGILWIDSWNASIRPGVATWSIVMLTLGEIGAITLSENAIAVTSAALGIYLAERNLIKRGK